MSALEILAWALLAAVLVVGLVVGAAWGWLAAPAAILVVVGAAWRDVRHG